MKTAQIRLAPDGRFIAMLSDGQRIEHGEIEGLAVALLSAGITADTAHCGHCQDWRESDDYLMDGQIIALKWALRRLVSDK